MEIKRKTVTGPEEKGETKGKFPKLKGMVERMKNKVLVLAVVSISALAPIGCGPDPNENPDGGHDADATTDAGTDADTTTDSGDGGQSLCAQYQEGHPNRRTFNLGVSESVEEGDHMVMLRELMELSGGMRATFACFDSNSPANMDFVGLDVGDQETVDVPGIGQTTVELCSTTALECKFQIPGPHEGDENCTATVTSTRAWGSN